MKRTTSSVCGALEASVGTRRPVMTMSAGAVNHNPRALVEKVLFCAGNGTWVCCAKASEGSKTSAALAAARCSQRAGIEGVERCMRGLLVADL